MSGLLAVEMLVAGTCEAPALLLDAPLSFWGGVDPGSGRIIDRQHPQQGQTIAGRVLVLPGIRGSTAAPGALLECLAAGTGPAAVLTMRLEIVPLVAVLTANLLDLAPPPVGVLARADEWARLATGASVRVDGQTWTLVAG